MAQYRSEWEEARQERIDDFRRFNDNESEIASAQYRAENDQAARRERLAKAMAAGVFGDGK
jgi:hypothetical protein